MKNLGKTFTFWVVCCMFSSLACASQAAQSSASCHDDSDVASVKDASLPNAPSMTLQQGQNTNGQQSQNQAPKQGKPDENASINGRYQGHFLYLVPAYHVQELRDPFKPLTVGDKFHIFAHNTFDQESVAQALFNTGIDELRGDLRGYGWGAEGFGKRLGAESAGIFTGNFLSDFFLPAVVHTDPRYFRKGYGTKGDRFWYAITRVLIARTDHGKPIFNIPEVAGNIGSAEFAQLYLPRGDRDKTSLAIGAVISIAEDAGINVIKEFGPEMHKKFRIKVPKEVPGSTKE